MAALRPNQDSTDRSESECGPKPSWLKEKVEGIYGADHKNVGMPKRLVRATLAIVNCDGQPPRFFHQFHVQPIIVAIAEGSKEMGIQLHRIALFLHVFAGSFQLATQQRQAFEFSFRCPEGIRSDYVNIHELR